MTREEAIKALIKERKTALHENKQAFDMAIEALKNQPRFIIHSDGTIEQIIEICEDCISREAVLDAINKYIEKSQSRGTIDDFISFEELVVKDLPSIQPKPKTDVLDKIRAEIHATAELHEDGDYYLRDEWIDEIFDDYKAESEDKE